ncbi:MAG: transposase [Acidobacteriota bacterium]|nr:transposase [Acidobacteriota bacterium]
MQQSIFIGLDLGSTHCQQTAVNADGSLWFSRSIPTSEQHLRSAFAKLSGEVRVHLESGELAHWAHSIIKPLVSEVIVSHPRTLAWIAKDTNKTDSIDARKLAELLRLNLVHPVYCEQSESRRAFKQLVVHYEQLSRDQARLKSKIKARLRTVGIIRTDSALFSQSGQAVLLDQFNEACSKAIFIQLFAVLNQMLASLEEAKRQMIEFSRRFPEVRLLQTAPGVGIITACRFVAYLQTPRRFSNKQKLWRYCRLGITRRESNGKRLTHPRLDAAGVGSLKDCSRKVFEAARRTKSDNAFKRFYEQSLTNTKNAVHARLSTQRKILATLRAMWLSMQPFQTSGG